MAVITTAPAIGEFSRHAAEDSARGTLRLRMDQTRTQRGVLDGAWWPYSTDLTAELPALVTGLDGWLDNPHPGDGQHISRVAIGLTIWNNVPTRIMVAGRRIVVAWFRSIDPHIISVSCPNTDHFNLLVIPPDTPHGPALAAMATAAGARNRLRGTEILAELAHLPAAPAPPDRSWPDTDIGQHTEWETDGGSVGH